MTKANSIIVDYSGLKDGCNDELEAQIFEHLKMICQKQYRVDRYFCDGDVVRYDLYEEEKHE